jgi:hypothetical protein
LQTSFARKLSTSPFFRQSSTVRFTPVAQLDNIRQRFGMERRTAPLPCPTETFWTDSVISDLVFGRQNRGGASLHIPDF